MGKTGDFLAKNKEETYMFSNEGLFNLATSEKRNIELYIFEKGVFWSDPGRKSRVFRSGQGRKMGVGWGGAGAFARNIPLLPYMGVPVPPLPRPPPRGSKVSPTLNFELQTSVRTSRL